MSVLSNWRLPIIKDPMVGKLPEGVYYELEEYSRLPQHNTGTASNDIRRDRGDRSNHLAE